MSHKINVIQVGLGPIGLALTRLLSERPSIAIVGAADSDPAKAGRDPGELAGLPASPGVRITANTDQLLGEVDAPVVLLTTVSSIARIRPTLIGILEQGRNVLSSCEELVFPWKTHPDIARDIDDAARRNGVSVLSTGVNPGFLMDFLPLVMTGVCREVTNVRVDRVQDASRRRLPFQRKIGAGLSPEEFSRKVDEGTLRHVGLTESMHMVAHALGWQLDRTDESIAPVLADRSVVTPDLTVEAGRTAGVEQIGRAYRNGREVITLRFRATIGQENPRDRIRIKGEPDIDLVLRGGVNGDVATCAIIANAIPAIISAPPGLRTMADMPLISRGA